MTSKVPPRPDLREDGRIEQTYSHSDFRSVQRGIWDFRNRRGEITADPKDFIPPPPPDDPGGTMYFDSSGVYLPVPPKRRERTGGKPWMKLEKEKFGSSINPIRLGGVTSPEEVLKCLRTVAKGIERVGEESVRGVDTVHYRMKVYRMKVSLTTLAQGLPGSDDASTPSEEWTRPIVPLDVWVGKQDRLLRRSVIDLSFQGAAESFVELDLFDHGVEANIVLPPAKDIYMVKDLEDYRRIEGNG